MGVQDGSDCAETFQDNSRTLHLASSLAASQPKISRHHFGFSKWVYLFPIEAINNIALSSFLGLLEKETDIVTAQQPDGTLYPA